MTTKFYRFWILAMAFAGGTGCGGGQMPERDYAGYLEKAIAELPAVQTIRRTQDSVTFIANYGNSYATQQLQTVFYVSGWFECTYVHDVKIEDGELSLVEKPRLHVREIDKVEGPRKSYGQQRVLEGVELTKFVESGFDLGSAGFQVRERGAPPRDFMQFWHRIHPDQE